MALPLLLMLIYGMMPQNLVIYGHEITKWVLPDALRFNGTLAGQDKVMEDSLRVLLSKKKNLNHAKQAADTMKHRVLLIGDSQCDGLMFPLNDYCLENGHTLVGTLIWYSATVYNFALADTIQNIVRKLKPTYVILAIGLNEIYARDLKKRQVHALKLLQKIDSLPYSWIGPAFWDEDSGIDSAYREVNELNAYYSSKRLVLSRAADQRHPDVPGYRTWFTHISDWISSEARYHLNLRKKPSLLQRKPFKSKLITLHAAKYKGY